MLCFELQTYVLFVTEVYGLERLPSYTLHQVLGYPERRERDRNEQHRLFEDPPLSSFIKQKGKRGTFIFPMKQYSTVSPGFPPLCFLPNVPL